jgi:hypothetical protein
MKRDLYERSARPVHFSAQEAGFKCAHCHYHVIASPGYSGVQNRNHCPYCLWSRHLDLYKPGDRLSACKGRMQPVGLTLKRILKKYNRPHQGELMLVHLCTECGKISANRIAADDDVRNIWAVYRSSLVGEESFTSQLVGSAIVILDQCDMALVSTQLFGLVPENSAG